MNARIDVLYVLVDIVVTSGYGRSLLSNCLRTSQRFCGKLVETGDVFASLMKLLAKSCHAHIKIRTANTCASPQEDL